MKQPRHRRGREERAARRRRDAVGALTELSHFLHGLVTAAG
jgi:hypothetical protein